MGQLITRAAPILLVHFLATDRSTQTETIVRMNFFEAIGSGFKGYVNWQDRSTRPEFWYWTLFTVLVNIFVGFFGLAVEPIAVFGIIFLCATALPWISVTTRRLHDKFELIWDHNCLLVFKEQEPKIKISLPEGYRQWNEGMEYSVDAEIDGTEYRFQVIVKEGLVWQVRTHSRKRTELSFVRMSE